MARGGTNPKLPDIKSFEISKARVIYKNGQTGRTTNAILNCLTLISKNRKSPVSLKLDGLINNDFFDAQGTFGPLADVMDPAKTWPFNITASAFGATLELKGAVKNMDFLNCLSVGFNFKGQDFLTLEQATGNSPTFKGPYCFSASARSQAPNKMKISNLEFKFSESDLTGMMEIQFDGKRPFLTAKLNSQKFDLPSMLNGSKNPDSAIKEKIPGVTADQLAKEDKIFTKDLLPVDWLTRADADITLEAGRVLLPKIAMTDLRVNIALKDGELSCKPVQAQMGEGTLKARLDLEAQGKDAVLDADIKISPGGKHLW